jgi:peroxiredoxin
MQRLIAFIPRQLFLSDPSTKFSQSIGWTQGERTSRYAIIVDHGKVIYAEKEPGREVTVSTPRFEKKEVGVAKGD